MGRKTQSSLEYLVLIGAIIVVGIGAFLMLKSFLSTGSVTSSEAICKSQGLLGEEIPISEHEQYPQNKGTVFYAPSFEWIEIVSTQADTTVSIQRLAENGTIVSEKNLYFPTPGQWKRYDNSTLDDFNFHKIVSNKPIVVYSSGISSHEADDDYYSLAGKDLWLIVPAANQSKKGDVFITAYTGCTQVNISDLGDGDDSQQFWLPEGGFWECEGCAEKIDDKGEVWHVKSSKAITVVAGYAANDMYGQIYSPTMRKYFFANPGENDVAMVAVVAYENNTDVEIKNLDTGQTQYSGKLDAGDVRTENTGTANKNASQNKQWSRVMVDADKTVQVVGFGYSFCCGASSYTSIENPRGAGTSYEVFTAWGDNLLILSLEDVNHVEVSGNYSFSQTLNKGEWRRLEIGTALFNKRIRISAQEPIIVYTVGSNKEAIAPAIAVD